MLLISKINFHRTFFFAGINVVTDACFRREILTLVAEDHRLRNCLISEKEVDSLLDCAHLCLSQKPGCRSINYENSGKAPSKCQLNNRTRRSKPENLISDTGFNYFEQMPDRSILLAARTIDNVVFEDRVYLMRNVRTRRLLLASGSNVFGSDANYYNLAYWRITKQTDNKFLIQHNSNKRYLYSEGEEISGGHGCEGGVTEAPACVTSDANNDNRALWNIVSQGGGTYLLENVVTFRYVYSAGEQPTGNEGGWAWSPKCVMADGHITLCVYNRLAKIYKTLT